MSLLRAIASVSCMGLAGAWSLPVDAQSCAGVSPSPTTSLSGVVVASGLSRPLFAASPPGDTGRLFIVEQDGIVKIKKRGQPPDVTQTFLDITAVVESSAGELGLLGLAFDPDYATSRHFWVNYTERVAGTIYTVVARYSTLLIDPDAADPASEVRVLRVQQPEENHKGGMLAFGPDGFLYVFLGDGGGAGDEHPPCGNGQNRTVLLGKVLRLDVRGVDPLASAPDCGGAAGNYGVPSTNPFRDGAGTGLCDEIWAYGLRNPWRASIDPANGDLYIADVGQACWEEVNWVAGTSTGGENYGWRVMEGTHCYNPAQIFTCDPQGATCAGSPPCNHASITRPVVDYQHSVLGECAVTGGYVYRGCKMPFWSGTYFYGEYCVGFVRAFKMSGGVPVDQQDVTGLVDPGGTFGGLGSFGVDGQGELYAVALAGFIRKFVPPFADLEVSAAGSAEALILSKTGSWTWESLFAATDVPVSYYRVYRGTPGGAFSCVLRTAALSWPAGGDPANPAAGQLFAYVVTAVDDLGQETRKGAMGTFDASTCP